MRSKYISTALFIIVIVFLFVFRNITYALICNSERIDRHMFEVMVQSAVSPVDEFQLEGKEETLTVALPKGAAEIEKNTFLVPSSRFSKYLKFLEENKGYRVERFGSTIWVWLDENYIFRISITPYTGAYSKLIYSTSK